MPDESLFSLDFTMPGAVPEPVPAPEPPAALELVPDERHAAPAKPAPVAPVPPPAIPAPLLEAAQLHASGDTAGASKILEAALKSGGKFGTYADMIWLGLFEVLQDLKRRDAFDKLAMSYARHFEKSPPTWIDETPCASESSSADIAAFLIPAQLNAEVGPALKDLMQKARTCHTLEIDVSQVSAVDDAGATLALRAIKALRDAKREIVLIGAESLAKCLSQTLEVMSRRNEPQWHLLIAMYDSLDNQEAFEDTAVNYAVTFEVSPPSWEVRDRSRIRTQGSAPNPAATRATSASPAGAQESCPPALYGDVRAPCAPLIQTLDALGSGVIDIDALALKRIETAAADELLSCLRRLKEAGASITVTGLPPLPYILLHHHHWAEVAVLKQRKS